MQNTRKRRDRNLHVVQAAIAKRRLCLEKVHQNRGIQHHGTEEQKDGAVAQKRTSAYGIPNYLSVRPAAEDDVTIKKHLDIIKRESLKKNKDYRIVEISMNATFADRRKLIVTENCSIEHLLIEYPLLFDVLQVSVTLSKKLVREDVI